MTERHCISSLELIALRSAPDDAELREHLGECERCTALLALLPEDCEARFESSLAALNLRIPEIRAALGEKPATAASPRRNGARAMTRTRVVLFGAYLQEALEGTEWDEVSLAEKADVSSSQLGKFLKDRFDLIHRRDAEMVASVIRTISTDPEEVVRGPLFQSLRLCPGGMVEASDSAEQTFIAASSFAGVDEERRDEEIQRDFMEVDESPAAQTQAVDLYLADVLAAI
jgi:hypothetical protein